MKGSLISSIGLATAQGCAADLRNIVPLHRPVDLPWPAKPWTHNRSCRPAKGIDSSLIGPERWQALARPALAECLKEAEVNGETPLIVASCNGGADGFASQSWQMAFDTSLLLAGTAWERSHVPVVSASCASGLHALFLANCFINSFAEEVVVLAVDVLSEANHDNFEGLRILTAESFSPWQISSGGFLLGEAAVALHLKRNEDILPGVKLHGPILATDLNGNSGLSHLLRACKENRFDIILGQGTGPYAVDEVELSALREKVDPGIPIATGLAAFGHTLGASGLLSVALAVLAKEHNHSMPVLVMDAESCGDGRALAKGKKVQDDVLVICRALSGACGVAIISDRDGQVATVIPKSWEKPALAPPLTNKVLQQLSREAGQHRPDTPPDVIFVRLEEPLAPARESLIGGRLLPSAVLEITPGFVPNLISQMWGFRGPAFCIVGEAAADKEITNICRAVRESGLDISLVSIMGRGEERYVEWQT